MSSRPGVQLTLRQALTWILVSVLVVTGSVVLSWAYFRVITKWRAKDPSFTIVTLVQTGPQKEALKSAYLAEAMGLSVDRPTNVYSFDINLARRRLLANPLIKEATVKTFPPGVVYVDYTLRQPIAYLGDYTNSAIDAQGVIFPYEPFLTPKRLPELYLGLPVISNSNSAWGRKVQVQQFDVTLELMSRLEQLIPEGMRLLKIDASRAFDDSYGRRELIVILEESMVRQKEAKVVAMPRILRLNPANIEEGLRNYLVLRTALYNEAAARPAPAENRLPLVTLDLRMPRLAFVKESI